MRAAAHPRILVLCARILRRIFLLRLASPHLAAVGASSVFWGVQSGFGGITGGLGSAPVHTTLIPKVGFGSLPPTIGKGSSQTTSRRTVFLPSSGPLNGLGSNLCPHYFTSSGPKDRQSSAPFGSFFSESAKSGSQAYPTPPSSPKLSPTQTAQQQQQEQMQHAWALRSDDSSSARSASTSRVRPTRNCAAAGS